MVHWSASHKVSSHQTRDLVYFADSSNTPWNPPTIFHPDLIATVPPMSLLLLCALLSQQSHVFPICAVLTINDSRKDLHNICQILGKCQCKWLVVSSSAPKTFASSSVFPEKFLLYMGLIESIEPNPVPQQHIDNCFEIRILHWEPCDPLLFNHQIFRFGHDCTSAFSARSPCHFVFKQISQFGSFGKWVKMLCLPDITFARGSEGNSWEELEASRCSGKLSSTRPCLNSSIIFIWFSGFCWSTRGVSSYFLTRSLTSCWCGMLRGSYGFLRYRPRTTNGTWFAVLHSNFLPFWMRCGFWPQVQW